MIDPKLVDKVDIPELVKALRMCSGFVDDPSCTKCAYSLDAKCKSTMMQDAAAAIEGLEKALAEENEAEDDMYWLVCEKQSKIEALQAEVQDLNEALKSESKARQNAEAKRYCCNCAHMDASMYDEAWYGICKLNDFNVEAIYGWGCTDWAKMEAQDGSSR